MKLCDLLKGVPVTQGSYDPQLEIKSLSYDSRKVQPGGLYVALRGEVADGHDYIPQAIAAGAVAVVCSRPGMGIETPNGRYALAVLSANWFGNPADALTLVGVTGTNGKTTTTHLMKAVLEEVLDTKVGLIGTNNILIGDAVIPAQRTTPESYELHQYFRQMVDAGCSHAVMEVSSHALVQHRTAGLHFKVGIFTNLTQDHLDYHKTMEEYRRAKGILFAQCDTAVLNLDDEAGRYYAQEVSCNQITYSENRDSAILTAKDVRLHHNYVEFQGVTREEIARVHLPIPGGFSIYNALASLGGCLGLGITLSQAVVPLRSVAGVKGRAEVVAVPRPYTVIIDYAHTPDALENILTTAREFTAGRLICLFGCGGDRDRTKRPIMGSVAAELSDLVVLTSDNPRTENPELILEDIAPGIAQHNTACHREVDRIAAIHWMLAEGREGDVMVLAGKGHEDYQEICGKKIHLDEREVIQDFFDSQK